jgi:hypothetical protein
MAKPVDQPVQVKADAPFISEGLAQEVRQNGYAFDPVTGQRITADDLS